MEKLVISALVILAIVHLSPTSEAFIVKTITIEKALPPPDAYAAITAQKTALVQAVQNVVTEKINTIASVVNSLVAAKAAAKQSVINSVGAILAAKPTTFTKTVTFNVIPAATTYSVPAATTATASGYITTTAAHPSAYKYYVRRY